MEITQRTVQGFGNNALKREGLRNEEKDIIKYDGPADTYVTCQPGEMAIFFPQDGHAPCIAGVPELRKAIFKIKA